MQVPRQLRTCSFEFEHHENVILVYTVYWIDNGSCEEIVLIAPTQGKSWIFLPEYAISGAMETKTIKNPSPLVQAVLALDEHFADLNRLASRIDEIDMKSNFDFEQSERLIRHFAETGNEITHDISRFVAVLNEARAQAEAAATKVAEKADFLKGRKDDVQEKLSRFQVLSDKVSLLNESLLQFKRPEGEALSDQDRMELKSRLGEIAGELQGLIDEAEALKNVGTESKIRTLEQNADAMRQSLMAVRQKISGLITLQ
jgi:hypothetical protein